MKKRKTKKKQEKAVGLNKKFGALHLNKTCKFFSTTLGGPDMTEPLSIQGVLKDFDKEYYYVEAEGIVSSLLKHLYLTVEIVETETDKVYREFDSGPIPTDEGRYN